MDDPCLLDLHAAAAALRARELSSLELTQACLHRARRMQERWNAFITLDEAGALAMARRADTELARGERRGPLHGVPLAHKDMFDRAGRIVTHGSRLHAERRPDGTASVLRRLDAAGAVDLGGLNMSEFACNPFGLNVLAGPARNPRDPERIAGGSSSGSAAAVAGCLAYGSLGSDTGGSVRVPAAYCGVVGLLTTPGRVSVEGAMPLSPSLDAVGPVARNVRDCAALFEVVAQAEVIVLDAPARGRCVGVPPERFCAGLPSTVQDALRSAMEALRAADVELVEVAPPDFARLNAAASELMLPEILALHADDLRDHGELFTPWVRERMLAGARISAQVQAAARTERPRSSAEFFATRFARAEALLLPVTTGPAPLLADILAETTGEAPARPDLGLYTRWTNYLGLPAVALPAGVDAQGLPRAVQLVGRPASEALLLTLAWHAEAGGCTGAPHGLQNL